MAASEIRHLIARILKFACCISLNTGITGQAYITPLFKIPNNYTAPSSGGARAWNQEACPRGSETVQFSPFTRKSLVTVARGIAVIGIEAKKAETQLEQCHGYLVTWARY
jgi:hypothetical protein